MRIEICTRTNTVRIFNKKPFNEADVCRNPKGEFAPKGTIIVRGNELAGFGVSGAELRAAAVDYYKKHLAGTTVKHPELGEIIFSQGGYRKPISFSADERKLRLFPFLPEIIKRGKIIETEKDRDKRPNVKSFYVLSANVNIGNQREKVRITIRRDDKGNLYYDHVIAKKTLGSSPVHNTGRGAQGVNNSVNTENWIVNLFL